MWLPSHRRARRRGSRPAQRAPPPSRNAPGGSSQGSGIKDHRLRPPVVEGGRRQHPIDLGGLEHPTRLASLRCSVDRRMLRPDAASARTSRSERFGANAARVAQASAVMKMQEAQDSRDHPSGRRSGDAGGPGECALKPDGSRSGRERRPFEETQQASDRVLAAAEGEQDAVVVHGPGGGSWLKPRLLAVNAAPFRLGSEGQQKVRRLGRRRGCPHDGAIIGLQHL